MAKIIKVKYTFNPGAYKVQDGVVSSVKKYDGIENSDDSTGYLDDTSTSALMFFYSKVARVDKIRLREMLTAYADSRKMIDTVNKIFEVTFDREKFTDEYLKVSTQYKLADRNGGDFDSGEVIPPRQVQNTEPLAIQKSPMDYIQDEARKAVNHELTVQDIKMYERILYAIKTDTSNLNPGEMTSSEIAAYNRALNDDLIEVGMIGDRRIVRCTTKVSNDYMQQVVNMYDAVEQVQNGQRPGAAFVAATAMNLDSDSRERLGIVNQGVQQRTVDTATNRRFGSTSDVGIQMIHRSAKIPSTKPIVMEDTPAWYSAMVLSKNKDQVMPYAKPKEMKYKTNVDKRFPMYAVPMSIDGQMAFAYLDSAARMDAPDGFYAIPTWREGCNWIARILDDKDNSGIKYYPSVLQDVISKNSALFPDIDLTGKVRIIVKNVNDFFSDDTPDKDITEEELAIRNTKKAEKEQVLNAFESFFKDHTKLIHVMKIDWNTGFVIALTEEFTPILIMACELQGAVINYPRYVTVIPVSGNYGFAVIGLDAAEIASIEKKLQAKEDVNESLPGNVIG